jgi:hypothetical protein
LPFGETVCCVSAKGLRLTVDALAVHVHAVDLAVQRRPAIRGEHDLCRRTAASSTDDRYEGGAEKHRPREASERHGNRL